MPKNSADPKKDPADNRADQKNNQQKNGYTKDEKEMLNINKADDYVPSINGISKNKI
ncbi:hypothetical protein [Paenibacillus monticola]|uniref:Uncharacterized protein n=1 Tax=Paenibacillus monticola TaxID=2666075 RepID=A0A7X2L375_9BACL|nr:hypothetical protein [Paenibacillus monticola]MRN55164.1 hypothetical protein [Paenibacillus monticola]